MYTPVQKRSKYNGINVRTNNNQKTPGLSIADPIGVYCRVRPWGNSEEDRCVKILDDKQIVLTPPDTSAAWKLGVAKEFTYSFQKVFGPEVEQQEVQDCVALPLVEDVLRGKNALLFAYGVTGSGKTYTMSGNSQESGIMPRSFDVIFNSISKHQALKYVFKPDKLNGFDVQSQAEAMLEKQKELIPKTPRSRNGQFRFAATPSTVNTNNNNNDDGEVSRGRVKDPTVLNVVQHDYLYSVFVTYVEIYNNFVYDLLDENSIDDRAKKFNLQSKMLREDPNHNVYINGGTEIEVTSSEEAFEVFLRGQRRRKQAHTCLNTESSRSHAIFNIRIVQAPLDVNGEEVLQDSVCVSQLSLVDLAGSERYGRTGATGDRLKEAGNINNSLMTLRKCMDTLRENQQCGSNKQPPFRDSKLTHYLKNYFVGEGRVRMIICLNPRNDDFDESIHVMTFAELTQEVQITRPQERKPDVLTPGRRKANEIFKEARRRIIEDINIDEEQIPTDVNMVFGLGPPLPCCQMTKSDEEELITNLRRTLEVRIKGRAELAKILNDKRHNFRIRLVDVERDLETLRMENTTLKYRIEQVMTEKDSTDKLLRNLQTEKTEQEVRIDELERENRLLKEEVDNARMELRQSDIIHMKEREKLKGDLDLQRELDGLKTDRQLQRKEAMLKATYKNKEKTLEAVRQLVQSADIDVGRHSRPRRRSNSESLSTASSESDVPATYSRTPLTTRSRVISAPHLITDRSPQKSCSGGITISNLRHNRANSTDRDTWLEHTPGHAIKTGTVMQPVMKKKKSVNQLTNADDIVNKGKYCLNLQETDGVGGMETILYKGDVLPSRTGGAQVVFNDVEILKQVSPSEVLDRSPSRKRSSSALRSLPGTPLRGNFLGTYDEVDENGKTLAERCATGIGHQDLSNSKRARQN